MEADDGTPATLRSGGTAMTVLLPALHQEAWGAMIVGAAPPFVIREVNAVAARWLARAPEAVVGQPLAGVAPLARGPWIAALDRAVVTGESAQVELEPAPWRDGQSRALSALCVPFSESPGAAPTVILTLLIAPPTPDAVTDLDQVSAVIAPLTIPAWLYDDRGQLIAVNDATLRLFDVASLADLRELIGATFTRQFAVLQPRLTSAPTIADVTADSTLQATRVAERETFDPARMQWASNRRREQAEALKISDLVLWRALNRRTAGDQILSVVHPTQQVEIILRASAAPILQPDGQIAGALHLTLDATDELLRQGQRDAVLAMAGHDLRNPLTPAKALVQQLRQTLELEGGFEREVANLDRVLDQLQRILQISTDLDAVAATSAGSQSWPTPTCELVQLCEDTAAHLRERRPSIKFVVQANETPIRGVWGRRHLERVLLMLAASAARRSRPGQTVTIRLRTLRSRTVQPKVKVEIADQSAPLPAERLAHLRTVLSRGGAALSMGDGSDLDISVIQTVLGLYRGHLLVNSGPRQGTTFWFTLPLPPPRPAPMALPRL